MGAFTVTGPKGEAYAVTIQGSQPTPDEQKYIDHLSWYGSPTGATEATQAGAVASQSPEQELARHAQTQIRGVQQEAANERNVYSGLSGLAGGLGGMAFGFPPPIGAAAGAAAGTLIGKYANEPGSSALRKLEEAGTVEKTDVLKEAGTQAATSLLLDTAGAGLGKLGRATSGLGDRTRIVREIDEAAEAGIRTTAVDVGASWLGTYRKVAAIFPILAAPFRGSERNRAREIAASIGKLRGPLDPLVGEAEISAQLLKAASNTFDSSVPWYKMFYGEAENYAKANNITFDVSGAVQEATDYSDMIERGRRVLNRTTGRAYETTSTRAYRRDKRVSESGKAVEGTFITAEPGSTQASPVGPQSRVFQADPSEMGMVAQETGTSTTKATVQTTRSERGLVRSFDEATDVAGFLDELRYTEPKMNFYQLDRTMKEIDEAWKVASNTQRGALTRVREGLENAAKTSGDERFNFLYSTARGNFKTLKEFFANPQARKFQLVDSDVFDTAITGFNKGEKQEVSQLYKNLFQPEIGPDGVRSIAKMVHADTMDRAVRLNVRQRLDKHMLDLEDGKVNWAGLRAEFGLHDPTSLRYQTFNEMLSQSKYGMDAEKFGRIVNTLEQYVGDRLPQLSTQLIRSSALGGPGSALRNLSAGRAFNLSNKLGDTAAGSVKFLLGKAGVVGAILGARSLGAFLADPDKLRVLMKYVDETQVPIAGSGLPATKFGLPVPGATTEVGSGARQTYLATNKPVAKLLEKTLVRYLAVDLANKLSTSSTDAKFKAKELESQFLHALEHPEQAEGGPTEAPTNPFGMFQQYFPSKPN